MNFFRSFSMAIKGIWSNKARSFLTMLGIIIGVSSVITLVSVLQGTQAKVMEDFEKMGTNKINVYYSAWGGVDVTQELYTFCRGLDEYVLGVTPNASTYLKTRYRTKNAESRVSYANEDYDLCNSMTVASGRGISYSDTKNRVRVCVLGSYNAKNFFGMENPIGKEIKIQGYPFTVIGVYEEKFEGLEQTPDNVITVPYTTQRTLAGTTQIEQFVVKAKDNSTTTRAVDEIKAFLKPYFQNEYDYNVYSANEWMEQANESQQMLTLVVAGVASISLLVGGIGIMNIMLVSVAERTREIGIRMAIGARRRDIVLQFLIEAGTVSAIGGLLGIALGFVGSMLLSAAVLKTIFLPTFDVSLLAFGFSALLGVFFGFYPAQKASRMQPVEALRNN